MSNAMERIKNKIRNSSGASVHAQLIDTSNSESSSEPSNTNVDENRNKDVNVNVSANLGVAQYPMSQNTPVKREKRKKFEELYKRDTFWIKNDIKDQLDALCKGERGEKTRIINEALQAYLNS